MRELLPDLDRWLSERGEPVALATVVRVFRSAPRPEGAKLAVSAQGELSGSVSGGCVEAAVAEEAGTVLETGQPKLLRFGIGDDTAWDAGLTCGGAIEIFVERLGPPLYRRLRQLLLDEQPFALATVIGHDGPVPAGTKLLVVADSRHVEYFDSQRLMPGDFHAEQGYFRDQERLQRRLAEDAGALLHQAHAAHSEVRTYSLDTPATPGQPNGQSQDQPQRPTPSAQLHVFLDVFPLPPHLVIFGAVHVAIPLVRFAHEVGFRTTVVDPRSAFATPERLGHAGKLIHAWPQDAIESGGLRLDESSYVAVLTHDPKLDEPAIRCALAAGARYVGAIGSRRTQADRATRLRAAGMTEEQIRRVRGPIGLDIGARTPEEIALAIMGEVVAAARGVTTS